MPTLDWNVSFHRFETEINGIASFPKKDVVIIYMHCGLFQKKIQRMRTWNFQGYWRAYGNSWNQVKKSAIFTWSKNNNVEFPWDLLFGLGIPKGSSTTLWNFLRWSFVFSRISKDKVTNPKIPGIFWKKYGSTSPAWFVFWE